MRDEVPGSDRGIEHGSTTSSLPRSGGIATSGFRLSGELFPMGPELLDAWADGDAADCRSAMSHAMDQCDLTEELEYQLGCSGQYMCISRAPDRHAHGAAHAYLEVDQLAQTRVMCTSPVVQTAYLKPRCTAEFSVHGGCDSAPPRPQDIS
jgi:hypothetical protein